MTAFIDHEKINLQNEITNFFYKLPTYFLKFDHMGTWVRLLKCITTCVVDNLADRIGSVGIVWEKSARRAWIALPDRWLRF